MMTIEFVTKEDLQNLRAQLIGDIKKLLAGNEKTPTEWLRSSEVRKLLKISPGTLQTMRINGQIKSSKVGGINFYRASDIQTMLQNNEK